MNAPANGHSQPSQRGESSELSLTVLGSGTAIATKRRGGPGYLLEIGSERHLWDLGAGSLRQLARLDIGLGSISRVCLSHAHIDHIAELPSLLFARRNPDLKDCEALSVHGWRGLEQHYEKLKAVHGRWVEDKSQGLSLRDIHDDIKTPDWRLQSRLVDHIPGALGFRLETSDGRVIAYSGDTDMCEQVIELGREADLFIVECSFPDQHKVGGHLTPSECGEIGARSGCKRLMLSHFYPICDDADIEGQCQATLRNRCELIVAEDLMTVSI